MTDGQDKRPAADGPAGGQLAAAPPEVLASRLGFLLKHAQLRLGEAAGRALAPFGIDGRELAVLVVLAAHDPLSQLEAAGRLGVDRTTMVALLDTLEDKGLVERRRSPHDRRKNLVELTTAGHDRLRQAERAREQVERGFLAPLSPSQARGLVSALQILVTAPADGAPGETPPGPGGEIPPDPGHSDRP